MKKHVLSLQRYVKLLESRISAFFSDVPTACTTALAGHLGSKPSCWGGQNPALVLLASLRTLSTQVPKRGAALRATLGPSSWLAMDRAACGKGPMPLASTCIFGLHVHMAHTEVVFSTVPWGAAREGQWRDPGNRNIQPP